LDDDDGEWVGFSWKARKKKKQEEVSAGENDIKFDTFFLDLGENPSLISQRDEGPEPTLFFFASRTDT
jgi:hypothetical protein